MVLMRYGYHGPYALAAALENEKRMQFWREYIADLLCLNVRAKYADASLSFFSEIVGHARTEEKPLTTDEIINGILGKLDQLAG